MTDRPARWINLDGDELPPEPQTDDEMVRPTGSEVPGTTTWSELTIR